MDTPENFRAPSKVSEVTEIMAQQNTTSSSSTGKQGRKSLLLRITTWLYHWFQENTFAPHFLSGTWSHPIFGYLAALVFQLMVAVALIVLIHVYPSFRFPESPLILVILLVALGWGVGSGIIAMLVGASLLIYFILPPVYSLEIARTEDVVGMCLYVVVGLTISILASNTERGHRISEQLRVRLNTIIEAIPDSLVLYDSQGRRIQQNRVAREINAEENLALNLAEMSAQHIPRSPTGTLLPLEALPLARALRGETVVGAEIVYRVPVKQRDRLVSVSAAPLYTPSAKTIEGAVTITRELTERQLIEDALRASEERYRTIVQTANEGVWLIDTQANTIYVNDRMATMLGVRTEEMIGHSVLEFVFPEDEQEGRMHIRNNLQGQFEQFDFRFRREDGSALYTLACTNPTRDGGNSIVGALGLYSDVTERKRAEEQERILAEVGKVLASTLDYQETLANIARVVVPQLADWFTVDLVDAEGNFELVEIGHKDPDQAQWARTLREKFPVDSGSPTGAPHVVRTGQSELYREITDEMMVASIENEEELAIARQLRITSAMNVPLIARGRTIGVVGFVSTESGRKYDEHDLALAEEVGRRAGVALDNARLFRDVQQARDQLDIILQGVADGIIVYDPASQIIYANEVAAQMTGFASVGAMLEVSNPAIVAKYEIIDEQGQPFPSSQLTHRRVLAGEREAQAIIGSRRSPHLAPAGQPEHWSLVKSRPVLDEQGEVAMVITITHDITERMQAERRKDEFISMASHELKTPVTSLKGFAHVLQRRLIKQGDEQGQQYLARMDTQLNKLAKLINDLLDISKMQAGKLAYEVEQVDLDALVQEMVENVQATTSTHQIVIEGKAEGYLIGDKDRLEQVFINLLTNAIKYSPQAKKVIVRLSREQERAIVSVQDFGIGISMDHYQKIFERFYQVTDPEEKTYPGLGLGLYISSEIIERHHGRIWVESSKGQGSTFFVALPLTQEAS